MKITILVPTYRRPDNLQQCLAALKEQIRKPDEIILIVRDTDHATREFLEQFDHEWLPLRIVIVMVPGVIAAMNAGRTMSSGDIIAFTDDDATPHPDWLQKIESHFENNPHLAGVGGRDRLHRNGVLIEGSEDTVGKLQWFGRLIGNHHLGEGSPREVDILKGVNMSFRQSAIHDLPFDCRLRGSGAQVHFEIAFCLVLKKRGWRLLYDPSLIVDHYTAQRFDEDQREQFNPVAFSNAVHNETVALLDYLPLFRQLIFLSWAVLVGTRKAFGLVQLCRFFPKEGALAWQKYVVSVQGRYQGWLTHKKRQPKDFVCSQTPSSTVP